VSNYAVVNGHWGDLKLYEILNTHLSSSNNKTHPLQTIGELEYLDARFDDSLSRNEVVMSNMYREQMLDARDACFNEIHRDFDVTNNYLIFIYNFYLQKYNMDITMIRQIRANSADNRINRRADGRIII
jgi:hypothetical protein